MQASVVFCRDFLCVSCSFSAQILNSSDSLVPSSFKTTRVAVLIHHAYVLRPQGAVRPKCSAACSDMLWVRPGQSVCRVNTCRLQLTNTPAATNDFFFNFLKADSACSAPPPFHRQAFVGFLSCFLFFLFCQPFCCFSACAAVSLDWTRQLPPMPLQTMACQSRPKWCTQCGGEVGPREQSTTTIWPRWAERHSDH